MARKIILERCFTEENDFMRSEIFDNEDEQLCFVKKIQQL